jgi:hypothetical protein
MAYLSLFHFAKSVCSMAAHDHQHSARLRATLNEARAGMMHMADPVSEPGIGEQPIIPTVHDALARYRGRPKKRAIPTATVRAGKARHGTSLIIICDLCHAAHELAACPYYYLLARTRAGNISVVPETGQRKCPLCWGYGHQKRTCPCRRQVEQLTQEQHQEEEE